MPPRTFHIVSLGCPKNTVDAEVMLGRACELDFVPVEQPADADVLVVNTCGFIEPAKKESIDTIFALAQHKAARCKRLVVTGCLVQRYANDLAEQIPEIDYLVGTGDVLEVTEAMLGRGPRMRVGPAQGFLGSARTSRQLSTPSASAYLKISEGCDRRCAFCVIPQIKGKLRSRPIDDLVLEASALAMQGVVELNLVSQDTLAFGRDLNNGSSLAKLVLRLADVAGIHWVRILYLYPDALDDALVDLLAHHPHVVPYVDMPMQHASSTVLRRMRRGHDERRLRGIVDRLRVRVPNIALRSAFIVGFPGETQEEFEQLESFVRWARFDHVGVFRYSDEEGTPAHELGAKVPGRVSYNRFRRLMSVQRGISRANNRARRGSELEVLVEGASDEHEWVLCGRHAGQAPEIDGRVYFTESEVSPGQIWRARVIDGQDYDLVVQAVGDGPIAQGATRRSLPIV